MKRTHTCGELDTANVDKEVILNGWVHSRRDHGGVIFIDLRDRYGLTQAVFNPDYSKELHKQAEAIRREDVISIKGKVRPRGKELENPKLKTGKIEVFADKLEILNKAETPPLEIDERVFTNEDVRLKYRYLDLRKPAMQNNLIVRHKTVKVVRDFLDKEGFLEIETPILAKSTPEGARDYLIPSRVNPGTFFALPQSPQLFKQLLMVSGFDRYFQIAKCFRDEDLRADRQPEFTQIDIEMSFIDEEDIYGLNERMVKEIWKTIMGIDINIPFKRITYKEAMDKYGTDKPDVRFGLTLVDITDIAKDSDFKVFTDNIKSGGVVKTINAKACAEFSRKDIDELISFVQIYDAKGLAWMKYDGEKLESSVVKFFNENLQKMLVERLDAKKGDLLLFVSDHKHFIVNAALGNLRVHLAKKLNLIDKTKYEFLWVTDFPLLEFDEDLQRHVAVHHPFTSPKEEDLDLLETAPGKIRAKAYDLALNGVEIGGGSIRIHKSEIQEKMFNALGISKKEAEQKFGFLLEAFKYGAPPHGGIAFGLDRLIAILTGNESIREVIAFPKTKDAESLMEGSPSEVSDEQLKELHIKLDIVRKKESPVFEKIRSLLDKNNIQYEVMEHEAVFTSEQAAKVRGTELKQGCKALILKTDSGFVQAVVSGAKEIDLEKLKKQISAKEIYLADAKQVKQATDCNIGSVPPFGVLFNIPVYFDKSVADNKAVAFNAGSHTKSIKMDSSDLIKLNSARILEFSLKK